MPALAHIAPIGYSAQVEHIAPIHYEGYRVAHVAPIGYVQQLAHAAVWGLNAPAALAHVAPYAMTERGLKEHIGSYDLLTGNPARLDHRASWSLLRSDIQIQTGRPFLVWQGEQIELLQASVSLDEGGQFWNIRASIAKAEDYARLSRLDPVTLDIYGDEYALVIDSLGRSRSSEPGKGGGTVQAFDVVCRSVLWATLGPDAAKVTRTWSAPVTARAVVEELAGESVDWRIIDWTIPAGRLAAVNEPAIGVITRIAAAAGGVVESDADGGIVVRYLYPVSIPNAASATVDHEISEATGIESLSERMDAGTKFDRLTLSDASIGQGYLTAERDPDQADVQFGGEQQRFLAFHSPDVNIAEVLLSDGTLLDQGEHDIEVEDEEIVFSNTDQGRTARPVRSGFAYTWYGTGLGVITVSADGLSLRAASVGVGVARVSYVTRAHRYAVQAPTTSGGRAEFPIAVYVIGALVDAPVTGKTAMRINVQRGAGENPGDDVVEPLAGNENVLLNRGRNEIDAAAAKGIVSMETVYQNEGSGTGRIQPGQLVFVEDSQLGRAWRGKVTTVEHRIEGINVNTALTVERFLT